MIGRLVGTAMSLFGYFCVATILSQVILAAYLTATWKIDRERMVQVLAVAQGIDVLEMRRQADRDGREVSLEQVSYEQIRETRAVKVRHLELREQALGQGLLQLGSEQRKLAEETKRQEQIVESFRQELADLQQGAAATGLENARLKLESLKPRQAKEQLVAMLDNDELDDVVTLLAGMTDSKAAKIMAEFKLEGEGEQLYEILRRIREGFPESNLVANTQSSLNQAAASP
jgi:dGTP triphosphohydrolase